jgi:ketosteroid isomerase-like protein
MTGSARSVAGLRWLRSPVGTAMWEERMTRLAYFVAVAAAFGLGLLTLPIRAADAPSEIAVMEKHWAAAVESNDPDKIGSFLHPDFTFVNPRGVLLHRAEHLDDFREKRTVFNKVELSEVQIRVYGSAAVVTSRPKITGYAVKPAGKTEFKDQPARFTDTLIRLDGTWKSVARQMSLVGP